jgi:Zn-dependent protease with chaperone function
MVHRDSPRLEASPARLVVYLALFLAVAAPLASISWHELSEVLNGHVEVRSTLLGIGSLAALGVAALVLSRALAKLHEPDGVGHSR